MNQDSLTISTVLKSRNDELILKLCWDDWAFGSITPTKINAIATTTATTNTAAAAAHNSNTVNFVIAVTNTISATTTTTTDTNNNSLNDLISERWLKLYYVKKYIFYKISIFNKVWYNVMGLVKAECKGINNSKKGSLFN